MMSKTTISVSVAFDRIWTLAASMVHSIEWKDFTCILRSRCHTESRPTVCPFHCTNCRQIPTFASGMQVSSPLWAHAALTLLPAHGVLTFSHAPVHAVKQSIVHGVIISFAQHYFYWNWRKALFLFQLISELLTSITFYTYLGSIVLSCDLYF